MLPKDQWNNVNSELLKPKCEDPHSETGTQSYTMCCFQTLYDSFYLSHVEINVWCKSKSSDGYRETDRGPQMLNKTERDTPPTICWKKAADQVLLCNVDLSVNYCS